jgi:hypothetical protein
MAISSGGRFPALSVVEAPLLNGRFATAPNGPLIRKVTDENCLEPSRLSSTE